MALRRFIASRGSPKEIWSDNGTNFIGAERELRRAIMEMDNARIKKTLTKNEVHWESCPTLKWRFSTPCASHQNGVWERLIRSVRRCMAAIIGTGNTFISVEALRSVFAETMSILNSRPLCPTSDDPNDPESITPNHLLLQKGVVSAPGIFEGDSHSKKQWRRAQFIADCFWKRWIVEYFPILQTRARWTRVVNNIKEGQLVLVAEPNVPRGQWPLGRVNKLFPGTDNRVRSVEVRMKGGLFRRPVTKLCQLEGA
ncbi:Uncharacterised protein r2_g3590 [Pycnogonum litorale]